MPASRKIVPHQIITKLLHLHVNRSLLAPPDSEFLKTYGFKVRIVIGCSWKLEFTDANLMLK